MDKKPIPTELPLRWRWDDLTILKGVLLVSSILFLVLAFCPS